MPTIAKRDDDEIKSVNCETARDTTCLKSGEDRNLLGVLIALGAGMAYGLLLAICFMKGQSEGVAPAKTSIAESLKTRLNAAPGDDPLRPREAIGCDNELSTVARQTGDQLWPDPNTD